MKTQMLVLVATLTLASQLPAQQPISERFPTAAGGEVKIENVAGEVRVIGWNRNEIQVTGTLGRGSERLEVDRDRERPVIRVVLPRNARNVEGSTLEVRVPAGKDVLVRTVSAGISVSDVSGAVTGRSTSGDIGVRGAPREVRASSTSGAVRVQSSGSDRVAATTTSGAITVSGPIREGVTAESVSGGVTLDGVGGRISASTVSGDARVRGSRVRNASLESVSGKLIFQGDLARGATFSAQSHSGDVELLLPANTSSGFDVQTFSGRIQNEFGGEVRRTSEYGPGRELRTGTGDGSVRIRTFSGSVKLRRG